MFTRAYFCQGADNGDNSFPNSLAALNLLASEEDAHKTVPRWDVSSPSASERGAIKEQMCDVPGPVTACRHKPFRPS